MTDIDSVTAADRRWLSSAIELSRRSPRLLTRYAVGSLIVDHSGVVRATGYTGEIEQQDHAEEVALARLAGHLSHATIYSSLEPCTTRRSRPLSCTGAILAAGIERVVFAMREPLLFADCRGVELLRQGGLEVVEVAELAHLVNEINSHVLDPPACLTM